TSLPARPTSACTHRELRFAAEQLASTPGSPPADGPASSLLHASPTMATTSGTSDNRLHRRTPTRTRLIRGPNEWVPSASTVIPVRDRVLLVSEVGSALDSARSGSPTSTEGAQTPVNEIATMVRLGS